MIAKAKGIAETISGKVPQAVEAAKRSFGLVGQMTIQDGYRYEQLQTAALAKTEDTKEALAAFREKRKPAFHNR